MRKSAQPGTKPASVPRLITGLNNMEINSALPISPDCQKMRSAEKTGMIALKQLLRGAYWAIGLPNPGLKRNVAICLAENGRGSQFLANNANVLSRPTAIDPFERMRAEKRVWK